MKINEKSLQSLMWISILVCFVILLFLFIVGCSSSRKLSTEQSYSSDADAMASESSSSTKVKVNEHSGGMVAIHIDSIILYTLRIAPQSDNPPDSSAVVGDINVPFKANIYGVDMKSSKDDSKNIAISDSIGSKSSIDSKSSKSKKKESSKEDKKSGSSCTVWMIIFLCMILASILAVRFFDRK